MLAWVGVTLGQNFDIYIKRAESNLGTNSEFALGPTEMMEN
jgi:hypothetical protein